MGYVRSKTRSLGHILTSCMLYRPDCRSDTHENWSECLKMGHVGSKSRSLYQIIEDPMLVNKGCDLNPNSLMQYHTIRKAQVRESRAIMALLFNVEYILAILGILSHKLHILTKMKNK